MRHSIDNVEYQFFFQEVKLSLIWVLNAFVPPRSVPNGEYAESQAAHLWKNVTDKRYSSNLPRPKDG